MSSLSSSPRRFDGIVSHGSIACISPDSHTPSTIGRGFATRSTRVSYGVVLSAGGAPPARRDRPPPTAAPPPLPPAGPESIPPAVERQVALQTPPPGVQESGQSAP